MAGFRLRIRLQKTGSHNVRRSKYFGIPVDGCENIGNSDAHVIESERRLERDFRGAHRIFTAKVFTRVQMSSRTIVEFNQ